MNDKTPQLFYSAVITFCYTGVFFFIFASAMLAGVYASTKKMEKHLESRTKKDDPANRFGSLKD